MYEPNGGKNLIAVDGSYWDGLSNDMSAAYFHTHRYATDLWAYKGSAAKYYNFVINHKNSDSHVLTASPAYTKNVLCEMSRGE